MWLTNIAHHSRTLIEVPEVAVIDFSSAREVTAVYWAPYGRVVAKG